MLTTAAYIRSYERFDTRAVPYRNDLRETLTMVDPSYPERSPADLARVLTGFADEHPTLSPPVRDLVEAVRAGTMTPSAFDDVTARHSVADWRAFAAELVDVALAYIAAALEDHALTFGELETVRTLKRFLRIQEGDFLAYRREAVRELVGLQMLLILWDGQIDEMEERYQVEVQALFDLGYDAYLALTKNVVHGIAYQLESALEGRTELEGPYVDAFRRRIGQDGDLGGAIRETLATIETVFRLQEYLDATNFGANEPAGRGIPQSVKDRVWRRDGGRCVACGAQERLEFDHIIPFSKGGASTYRNVQLLCESCNRTKAAQIG